MKLTFFNYTIKHEQCIDHLLVTNQGGGVGRHLFFQMQKRTSLVLDYESLITNFSSDIEVVIIFFTIQLKKKKQCNFDIKPSKLNKTNKMKPLHIICL